MTSFRILHVDDEPDTRRVVALSLVVDPQFSVRSCTSGEEAVVAAAQWSPHLILCDVQMPVMDGPATLARLRENPRTAEIPVIFMTARAQERELMRLKALGASGVIAKPFNGKSLRESVREHLPGSARPTAADQARRESPDDELAEEMDGFRERLRTDAATLVRLRAKLPDSATATSALEELQTLTHKLAGAAGLYGFDAVSLAAAALEQATVERRFGRGAVGDAEAQIDALIAHIKRDSREPRG
jgi:CheY-like chemotaxis protein/HPt (histidine-containing phosphotransfer) domain-containing protein